VIDLRKEKRKVKTSMESCIFFFLIAASVESISVSNSENEMGTPKERTTGWELYY
jgi:hypothetical protein